MTSCVMSLFNEIMTVPEAHKVFVCQFTEQETKLMQATSEFHHKVTRLWNNPTTVILQMIPDCDTPALCCDWLCWMMTSSYVSPVPRKLTWKTTTWRSTRRSTSRWPHSKPCWSPWNWRRSDTWQVTEAGAGHRGTGPDRFLRSLCSSNDRHYFTVCVLSQRRCSPAWPSLWESIGCGDEGSTPDQVQIKPGSTSDQNPHQTRIHFRPGFTSGQDSLQTMIHFRPESTSDQNPHQARIHFRPESISDQDPLQTRVQIRPGSSLVSADNSLLIQNFKPVFFDNKVLFPV